MYEYENIENVKPGDVVEAITSSFSFTKGKLYIVSNSTAKYSSAVTITIIKDDKGSTTNGWHKDNFKPVKTLPGSEAKVGDTVIRFKGGTDTCPTGTIFTVLKVGYNSLYYASALSAYTSECKVLCKASTVKSEPDTPRVAIVTKNISGHPIGSRIVPINTSNNHWKLAEDTNSFAYAHGIGSSCEWEDTLTTHTGTVTFIPLDETSPATLCSQPTLNPIPEEETMTPTTENITIAMTADEYAKHQKSNKPAKPKTQLETAPKWFTIWYNLNGNIDCQTTESPKKAKKALQHPSKLGFTFRSYLITESATTDIPVVNVAV